MLSSHMEDVYSVPARSRRRASPSEPALGMNLNKGNKEFAKNGTFQLKRLTIGLDRTMEHCEDIISHISLWI